jgi:hypothetical protein
LKLFKSQKKEKKRKRTNNEEAASGPARQERSPGRSYASSRVEAEHRHAPKSGVQIRYTDQIGIDRLILGRLFCLIYVFSFSFFLFILFFQLFMIQKMLKF